MIRERNIVTSIILTIVTCGIYGIIWFIGITDDVSTVNEEPDFSGGKAFLLTLVTCGIYSFYWAYKIGKSLGEAKSKKGMPGSDNSVLYLILSLVGLNIVTYCLAQDELNKLANQGV